MITKKQFSKLVNAIKENSDRIDKVQAANWDIASVLVEYCLQDELIEALEIAVNAKRYDSGDTLISSWIYDNEFGRKNTNIKTPEQLYDLCLKENKNENTKR